MKACFFTAFANFLTFYASALPLPASILGQPGKNATFDYVVIGGGTAGLVVATRLAQANKTVAVIEAGGFYEEDIGELSTVPAYAIYGAGASPQDIIPQVDWGFVTTPQAGLNNRRLHYARGKTLGGSSARNYFTYQRPTIESLNRWAAVVGDDNYTYENLLPYFKKGIHYNPPNNTLRPNNASVPAANDAFSHGSGTVHVSTSDSWVNPISSYVKAAWKALGAPVAHDFVSGTLSGVQYAMNTINPSGNIRSSSYSFLESVGDATFIRVYNNTLAKEIIFRGNEAVGALVASSGNDYVLFARKEVILSAGAFQSPQLLMVSGVGPRSDLERLKIPIVSELSGVGQNLEDHFLFGASYQVNLITHSALGNTTYLDFATKQFAENGTGMLSNPGGEILTWEKVSAAKRNALTASTEAILKDFPGDWPDFEFLMLDAYSGDNQNYIDGAPRTPFMYASPAASIMVSQSRGNITITSTSTAQLPVINPNWLTDPADQELAVIAFKRVREMMDTDIMRGVWVEEILPGRNITSDADILNAIRQTGIQVFHASSTCKMGKPGDTSAVIDSQARVFGTNRLRVVDASSMPFLPPGHPQALIYAIAEKIVDDILNVDKKRVLS